MCNSLGQNCREVTKEVGNGIPGADFVFYISALETDRCKRGYTVAYAAHCQQEAALDRLGSGMMYSTFIIIVIITVHPENMKTI